MQRERLTKGLKLIEDRLKKTKYLCGDEVSIADLSACSELDSSRFIQLNLDGHPKTKAWLYHMIDENPIMCEIHQPNRQAAAEWHEKRKGQQRPKL